MLSALCSRPRLQYISHLYRYPVHMSNLSGQKKPMGFLHHNQIFEVIIEKVTMTSKIDYDAENPKTFDGQGNGLIVNLRMRTNSTLVSQRKLVLSCTVE